MVPRRTLRKFTRAQWRATARSGVALGMAAMAAAILFTWIAGPVTKGRVVKSHAAPLAARDPEIDVLLTAHEGSELARFSAPGGWRAVGRDGAELASTASGSEATIGRAPDGNLTLRGADTHVPEFTVEPLGAAPLRVGKASYRGRLVASVGERGLRLVNRVPLEAYLASVVGSEMYASSTKPAALEAQAIAARTYARWEIDKRGRTPLPDSQEAQAYHGVERETRSTRAAVAATANRVLYFDGDLLPAFYHSTCGGLTIDGTDLLGSAAPAPLRGGTCGYCGRGKFYRWTVTLTPAVLGAAASEVKVGPQLLRLVPMGIDADPWSVLELHGSAGSVKIPARKFRSLIQRQAGSPMVPSPFVKTISADPRGGIVVQGAGFGHGVGLCQVGAAEMGVRGFTSAQILRHYYPGAVVDSTERRGVLAMK